jgi:hypothetical protein
MALLRFEPIAAQIGKLASPAKLFPSEVLERVQRGELEGADPGWGPELRDFMAHYSAVVRAASLLLGAPSFERLARLSEAQQKEYQPGGPPRSPVYDDHALQHILAEVPQGLAGETPYSVLARLCSGDPARARLCELAQALAISYLDLYRVSHATASGAELSPLRGGSAFSVQISGPFLRSGDLILARVLALGGQRFIAASPYLLVAPERDWIEYLERVVLEHELPAASVRPAPASSAARSSAKLSPKQAARRRKEQKQRAAQHTPQEVIATHLRCGEDESFWLEFIIEAYAGERSGVVRLAGVPDRPESLPHSEYYTSASGDAEPEPPLQRVRRAAIAVARREGLWEREARALGDQARALGVKDLELHEADSYLLMAYCTLAARTERGDTALELSCRERELDPQERAVVESLARGRFAVLRIEHIQLDQALDVLDLLRAERVHVPERAATRQVALGDLILGWLCDAGAGVWQLEGGVLHVPAPLAPAVSELALQLREERRAEAPGETPAQGSAALVLPLLAHVQYLREHLPLAVL